MTAGALATDQVQVERYSANHKAQWDSFVEVSKNGTFLFLRDYMEYHAGRFEDCSLVFSIAGKVVALLPANASGDALVSHGGLTYGGFITDASMKLPKIRRVVDAAIGWMRENGFRTLVYKAVPRIYHRIPADEDMHILFQHHAVVTAMNAVSVVDTSSKIPYQERRRRGIRKAERGGCIVSESRDLASYWDLLTARLEKGHRALPVHTLEEMVMLADRFPTNIRLFAATLEGRMLAGVLCYVTERVAKTQYIAGSDEGLDLGAVDLTLHHVIAESFASKKYIDLGGSYDATGQLNGMLVDQKEGFGARTVVTTQLRLEV